jgi:CheY-like chemotaxis protein
VIVCVLLVEDEDLIREVMAECLHDAGFEVVEADSGARAIEALGEAGRFSILVTDFHMPGGLDGGQVAFHTRLIRPDLPVVITTGKPEALPARWKSDFGYNLLRKPYLPSHLVALVGSLVANTTRM